MKISFIVTNFMRVGGIRIILEYASRLQEKGHIVNIYYPFLAYNYQKGNSFLYLIKRLYWSLINIFKTKSVMSKFNIHFKNIKLLPKISNYWVSDADSIIASEWPTALDIFNLKNSKGKKFYLIQGHETHFSNVEYVEMALKLPLKKIVVSKFLNRLLIQKYGENSLVVNNAVNVQFFDNPNKEFDKKIKQIIFIDSSAKVKRIQVVIEILEKIQKLYSNVRIVSFGEKKSSYIPSYVSYFENPSDESVRNIYCSSDIFIGASSEEGFYLAPAEAMACKCSVIVTRVGAVEEYSEHMKSAIHIDPVKPHQILDAVKMLLADSELLKSISMAGYYEVRSKLNWENSLTKLECILKADNF